MADYPDWFLQKPYRPPTPAGNGETNRDALHLSVGRIAHSWEHLEGALYRLYITLFERAHPTGGNFMAYQAAFGAVISSSGRRDIIDAMVRALYHPDTIAARTILPVLTMVSRGVGRRNDAVHGLVVNYNHQGVPPINGLFVMPPMYVPLPMWNMGDNYGFKYRYNCATLSQIEAVIETIRGELNAVTDDLEKGVIGPFPEKQPPQEAPASNQTAPPNGQQ